MINRVVIGGLDTQRIQGKTRLLVNRPMSSLAGLGTVPHVVATVVPAGGTLVKRVQRRNEVTVTNQAPSDSGSILISSVRSLSVSLFSATMIFVRGSRASSSSIMMKRVKIPIEVVKLRAAICPSIFFFPNSSISYSEVEVK